MGTTITFRRGENDPTSGSGLTLAEPAFNTTLKTFHIGLGHGITAAWVGAPISGLSADIAAGITYKIPTAAAVKNYIGGLCYGNTGAPTITQYVSSFNGLTGAVGGVCAAQANTFTALQGFSQGIVVDSGLTASEISVTEGIIRNTVGPLEVSSSSTFGTQSGIAFDVYGNSTITSNNNPIANFSEDYVYAYVPVLANYGLTASTLDVTGNAVIAGNLTVSGGVTFTISENVLIEDNIITLNSNVTGSPSENAGIEIERGTSANVQLLWNESSDKWTFTNDGSTYYDLPTSVVTSFNGLTGAVTGVTVGGANTFTALNSFNAGVSATGLTVGGSEGIEITRRLPAGPSDGEVNFLKGLSAELRVGNISGSQMVFRGRTASVFSPNASLTIDMGATEGALLTGNYAAAVRFGTRTGGNDGTATLSPVSGYTTDRTINLPNASGTLALTSQLMGTVNGSTAATTAVTSFNGRTGAVTGASLGANTFTGLNSFNAGISSYGGTFSDQVRFTSGLSASDVKTLNLSGNGTLSPSFTDGQFRLTQFGPSYTTVAASGSTDRTITLPDDSGTVALTSQLMGTVNGSTAATTAVTSFNGRTGAVQGVSSAAAGTGISVSGTTGAVTITNIGVQSFNGATGAVQGVSSFNGLTGAVGGVCAAQANTFTALQTFNSGISASGGTFGSDITANTVRIGLGSGNIATNVCLGTSALAVNTTGTANVAVGESSLAANTTGFGNVGVGRRSLFVATNGNGNVGLGSSSLIGLSNGSNNIAVGRLAASTISAATGGIYIGYLTTATDSATNEIVIGTEASGFGSNTAVIGAAAQTAAYIYGLVHAVGGVSAPGGTFSALTQFTAGISAAGGMTLDGGKVWHSLNDGPTSGLDAGQLYGVTASLYASSLSTGLLYGGLVTINAGNSAAFDITAGAGYIVTTGATFTAEPNPVITRVSWTAKTGVTLAGLTAQDTTWIYFDSSGNLQQQPAFFTDDQVQSTIAIGALVHPSRAYISLAKSIPNVSYATDKQYEQFIRAFGPLKVSGHTIQPNGANLKLDRSSGTAFILGRNYPNNPDNPSVVADNAQVDCEFWRYRRGATAGTFITQTGQTAIDPNNYDDGTGTLHSVPSNKPFSIQRLFFFPDTPSVLGVYYGRLTYASISEAANNIHFEDFTEIQNTTTNAVFAGYLLVKKNTTNLTTAIAADEARIIQSGQFRSTTSGGGSVSTNLDNLSDVTITSVANDDLLIYDTVTSQWLNTPLQHIGVTRFNGLTGAVHGVSSFNGLTGAVQGVSAAVAGTGISVSGATGSVTITNIGVHSFNGSTGAVGGVCAAQANTFTALQSFNSGISSAGGTFTQETRFASGLSASTVKTLNLSGYGGLSPSFIDGRFRLSQLMGTFTTVESSGSTDRTITLPDADGTVALTSQLMGAVNGSTAATTAVTSFNGRTGAVQGVSAAAAGDGIAVSGATGAVTITNTGVTRAVAGTGISVSGATGSVTITNIGVQSFNGNTGAVTGVSSVNGATGAVTNVAKTNEVTNFSAASNSLTVTDTTSGDIITINPNTNKIVFYDDNSGNEVQLYVNSFGNQVITFPDSTCTLAGRDISQTFTSNNTFTSLQTFSAGISASGGVTLAGTFSGTTGSFSRLLTASAGISAAGGVTLAGTLKGVTASFTGLLSVSSGISCSGVVIFKDGVYTENSLYTDNIFDNTAGQLSLSDKASSRVSIGDYSGNGNSTHIYIRDNISALNIANPYGSIQIGDPGAVDSGYYIFYNAAAGYLDGGNSTLTNFSIGSFNGLLTASAGISAAGDVTFAGTVASDTGYRITSNAINAQTGTTYTFLSTDNGKIVTFNNASAVTVTIPTALPVGFNCTAIQLGAGQVGFTAASGLTLQSYGNQYRLVGQHASASVIEYTTNIVNLSGNLVV